jgi:hypothetical protein
MASQVDGSALEASGDGSRGTGALNSTTLGDRTTLGDSTTLGDIELNGSSLGNHSPDISSSGSGDALDNSSSKGCSFHNSLIDNSSNGWQQSQRPRLPRNMTATPCSATRLRHSPSPVDQCSGP